MAKLVPACAKFLPREYSLSNKALHHNAEVHRSRSERLVLESERLVDEIENITRKSQRDVNKKLDQRIEEVTFWERELNTKLDELSDETELLLGQKKRSEKALDSCSAPLCIIQQCLLNREKRVAIDLVHDEVEQELLKEQEVLEGVIVLLKRTLEQTDEQIRLNRTAKFYLEKDLQDKSAALKVDKFTANLTNNSPNIDYSPNVVRMEGQFSSSVAPKEWQDFTNTNIVNAGKQKNNSMAMRSLIDGILSQTTDDMLKQVQRVNQSFQFHIKETKDAKSRLEQQLSKVMDEISSQEKNIELLRKTIQDKEGPLMVAQMRLEIRAKRPNMELVRDPAQYRLISEVQEIIQSVDRLQATLGQAEAELRGLRRNQLALEEEIEIKTNSLYIDDVQCMNLRNSISINYF
ncbi:tektin-1 isoform X2 [Narcine bancroftii]|uniref:tektin-1 isoform X2 n=1 Tax=Narcine bancroftii TaxID=1343680 RepID=UPI0038311B06